MNPILINETEKIKFTKELKNNVNKILSSNNNNNISNLSFILTNVLTQNIEIVYYYLTKLKIKQITIISTPDNTIDIINKHRLKKYFENFFITNSQHIITTFKNFTQEEIFNFLDILNYIEYCKTQKLEPKWNQKLLNEEITRVNQYKNLKKYDKFNYLYSIMPQIPFSKFNIPTEKEDRFVFYFMIYSKKIKKEILKHLKILKVNTKILNIITNNNLNKEIVQYAIGYNYKNNIQTRETLYIQFNNSILIYQNFIKKYIETKHNITLTNNYNQISYYAIDFYNDREEIKIYDEQHIFKANLTNKKIENILKNKKCTKVDKYLNNKHNETKYEFSINKHFRQSDLNILKQQNIIKQNSKIFSLYIKNGQITKNVNYDL